MILNCNLVSEKSISRKKNLAAKIKYCQFGKNESRNGQENFCHYFSYYGFGITKVFFSFSREISSKTKTIIGEVVTENFLSISRLIFAIGSVLFWQLDFFFWKWTSLKQDYNLKSFHNH